MSSAKRDSDGIIEVEYFFTADKDIRFHVDWLPDNPLLERVHHDAPKHQPSEAEGNEAVALLFICQFAMSNNYLPTHAHALRPAYLTRVVRTHISQLSPTLVDPRSFHGPRHQPWRRSCARSTRVRPLCPIILTRYCIRMQIGNKALTNCLFVLFKKGVCVSACLLCGCVRV